MLQGNDGDKRKICFVITPIGPDNSPVRRHIDGVINEAIIPVLDELKFKVEVSHLHLSHIYPGADYGPNPAARL